MNIQPNRFFHLSLIFLVALNLVPHFNDYTVPTLAVGGISLLWRLLYEYQLVPLPNALTKFGLVVTTTYVVYQNYGQIMGLESGSALLICFVSLKLIDSVGYRDAMVVLFLNFMLLLARFFESQSLAITLFAAFDLIISTALLVQLHNGSKMKFDINVLLKTGLKLCLQIAPFMILLFFVFPRFSGQFIKMSNPNRGTTGFSEELEPGAISSLVKSDFAAFRVKFIEGQAPPIDERYWRGAVYSINQAMKWDQGKVTKQTLTGRPKVSNSVIKQEILLESYFRDRLFALDRPHWLEHQNPSTQRKIRFTEEGVFLFAEDYGQKVMYQVFSSEAELEKLSDRQRKLYLLTPKEKDPRVLKLVSSLKAKNLNNEQKARQLLKFYTQQFVYTLSPGLLKDNTLGEFLFEKRKGFCEHFAVSFAALMRLAGVPARVVTGFQGGQANDLSDYFLVTTQDAHAWTEIWSDQKQKWLRFDPTTVVAPLRLELGGQVYHSLNSEELLQVGTSALNDFNSGWVRRTFLAFDAISTNWNRFLLTYDQETQRDFFARLGFKNINQSLLLLVSLLILLSYFLWIRLTNKTQQKKESQAQKAYLNLRKKLSKIGIEKEASEGPRDFLDRCIKEKPEAKQGLKTFKKHYLQAEYGLNPQKINFSQIIKQIKL